MSHSNRIPDKARRMLEKYGPEDLTAAELAERIYHETGYAMSSGAVRKQWFVKGKLNGKPSKPVRKDLFDEPGEHFDKAYGPTLCWSCVNSVPNAEYRIGCEWSVKGKPVPGWDAVEKRLRMPFPTGNMYQVSYHVFQCPRYRKDRNDRKG